MNKKQTDILKDYILHSALHMLTLEEQWLKQICAKDLSVRELHVIEAVVCLSDSGRNTMAEIARYLRLSPASLTAAVNVLVKKEYLEREYSVKDRRVIYVKATDSGNAANRKYLDFVKNMMYYIGKDLDEQSADKLIEAVLKISDFFEKGAAGELIAQEFNNC